MFILDTILNINICAQNSKYGFLVGFDIANSLTLNKPNIYSNYRVFYPLATFNINLYREYKVNNSFSFLIEPGFIQKGGIVHFGVYSYYLKAKLPLNYLQLPILANIKIKPRFMAIIGPEFAHLMNRKSKLFIEETGFSSFRDHFIELSGLIGLEYCLFKKIDIGLRYNHGLNYSALITWSDVQGNHFEQSKVINQYFQFFIRYRN
jgi:hypothetical protein